ncbi:MAG: tetratricopeptide repeat protein [Cyanothece sp. SIO2G6]|nr:tetratricopeptide repeat protein [Cyanothece sp. SIO2G6]
MLALAGLCNFPQPAQSQALAPYTIQLDEERLEQQGFFLFRSAIEAFQRGAYSLDQASIQVQLASRIAPDNPQILAALGELYKRQQNYDEALTALQQAQILDPDNAAIFFEIGTVYLRQERYRQAAIALEEGLGITPNVFGALFDLGNAYFKLERYEQAIANYEKAAEVQDDLWFAINNIGLVLYERNDATQNDTEEAIRAWEEAIAMTEGKEAEPLLALAVAQFKAGQETTGLDQGIRALQLNSAYADLEFLRENLWGDRLLADTQVFLSQPLIQSTLAQLR